MKGDTVVFDCVKRSVFSHRGRYPRMAEAKPRFDTVSVVTLVNFAVSIVVNTVAGLPISHMVRDVRRQRTELVIVFFVKVGAVAAVLVRLEVHEALWRLHPECHIVFLAGDTTVFQHVDAVFNMDQYVDGQISCSA